MTNYLRIVNGESILISEGTDEYTIFSKDSDDICLSFDFEWINEDKVYVCVHGPCGDRFSEFLHSFKEMGDLNEENIKRWVESESAEYFLINEAEFDKEEMLKVATDFAQSLLNNRGSQETPDEIEINIKKNLCSPATYGRAVEAFLRCGQNMLKLTENPDGVSVRVYPSDNGITVGFDR